jgi:hypothetical protein
MDPLLIMRVNIDHGRRWLEMEREAEQHALAQLANEGKPNVWRRVFDRLPQIQITAPSVRIVMKPATEVTQAHLIR